MRALEVAVGIDVGWSAARRSFGVVVLDRSTRAIAAGSAPLVTDRQGAVEFVLTELARLSPSDVAFIVDGPFASGHVRSTVRLVEQFFQSGPFPAPRVQPAPTGIGSRFLESTRGVVDGLAVAGHTEMQLTSAGLAGEIVEIFPTVFMAALLPPHVYTGGRGEHSDDLWLKLIGASPCSGIARLSRALAPYGSLIDGVEQAPRNQRHDLRTAAISAIAGDWLAAARPGSGLPDATMFNRALGGRRLPAPSTLPL